MPDYDVIITARSPLAFSENKPGGIFQQSLSYVPGAVLRGALAVQWLRAHDEGRHVHPAEDTTCEFCTVLAAEDGGARFSNAYPVHDPQELPLILPATTVACKNHGRFPEYRGEEKVHPVFDTLIERLCWERMAPPGWLYAPTCPVCGERVETFKGVYTQTASGPRSRRVQQRQLTRVAINRRRNVAEDGMLYSPFVIDEVIALDRATKDARQAYAPTRFQGRVCGLPPSLADSLKEITHLGGGASRGLGQVQIEARPVVSNPKDLTDRLGAFSKCLAEAWTAFAALPGATGGAAPDGVYLALTLQSDAILVTSDGRPTMVYDAGLFGAQTGLTAELVTCEASYGYLGGWNAAWGLPKPTEVVTKMGSTYVYRLATRPADLAETLAALESEGIGRRRGEGFGQVRVAHEFHTVRRNPHVNS